MHSSTPYLDFHSVFITLRPSPHLDTAFVHSPGPSAFSGPVQLDLTSTTLDTESPADQHGRLEPDLARAAQVPPQSTLHPLPARRLPLDVSLRVVHPSCATADSLGMLASTPDPLEGDFVSCGRHGSRWAGPRPDVAADTSA